MERDTYSKRYFRYVDRQRITKVDTYFDFELKTTDHGASRKWYVKRLREEGHGICICNVTSMSVELKTKEDNVL